MKIEKSYYYLLTTATLTEVFWPFFSTLLVVDRKADSLKYLQKAIAYDPAYSVYLEHLESDPNNIASDLASSRREL